MVGPTKGRLTRRIRIVASWTAVVLGVALWIVMLWRLGIGGSLLPIPGELPR